MPSPVGHTLAGCCLLAAAADRAPALRAPAFGVALIAASNLPDIDFLGKLAGIPALSVHQGPSHSIAVVLLVAVPLALLLRRTLPRLQAWRWLAAAGLLHLTLDFVNFDSLPPIGIPLAWPLSDAYWNSPLILFPGTDRHHPFSARNLLEFGAEIAWLLPPLLFLTRRRIAAFLRRAAPGTVTPAGPGQSGP